MGRNKYPEITEETILDAAEKLFIQNGYEKTTLQNILDATKLSKGAIYYHFPSKEAIFQKVVQRENEQKTKAWLSVLENEHLTGREKLVETMRVSLQFDNQKIHIKQPYLVENPQGFVASYQSSVTETAPIMAKVLEQGVKDGSIQVTHPLEMAETILILSNIWLGTSVMPMSEETIRLKCQVYNQLFQCLGFDILDKEIIDLWIKQAQIWSQDEND